MVDILDLWDCGTRRVTLYMWDTKHKTQDTEEDCEFVIVKPNVCGTLQHFTKTAEGQVEGHSPLVIIALTSSS